MSIDDKADMGINRDNRPKKRSKRERKKKNSETGESELPHAIDELLIQIVEVVQSLTPHD